MTQPDPNKIDPYNPLDLQALGDSLLRELERRPTHVLCALPRFVGAGIYGLYYTGKEDPYTEIGDCNRRSGHRLPIYVGRSRDTGARQGLDPFKPVTSTVLYGRVKQHQGSIEAAKNLAVADFVVRVLVVMPIWIPLAEAMAIRRYQPLWNSQLEGFGIHAPGAGRSGQKQSEWDLLHPGRGFAAGLPASSRSQGAMLERMRVGAHEAIERFAAMERDTAALTPPPPERVSPERRSRSAASPRPKGR
jgi:hypothetical protein